MNKILILNLPGPVLKAGSRWYNRTKKSVSNLRYYPYPWFMGYATSLLKKNGFNVVLIDAIALEWTAEKTINYISELNPSYIICEPTWTSIVDDEQFLKNVGNNIKKIAVGNYATNYPIKTLEQIKVDYVVVGEYELSLLDFFKSNGMVLPKNFVTSEKLNYETPDLILDLDFFPFPERDDTPIKYYNEPSCYGKNIVMVSSRGCRLKCDFCNVESIYGKHSYRTRSPKNVVDEIVFLQRNYDFDEIYFDDDNMVSRKSHIDGICREIVKRNINVHWLCMGDGLVDDETLGLLAKSGCVTYKFGLEHFDEGVLKAIPKPLKKKRMIEIIEKCRELKIRSYVNLIIGLPGSTWEKDKRMIQEVIQANPDLVQFSIATPYPGTVFFNKSKIEGWLNNDDPKDFDATGKSVVSYPDYPKEKIEEMFHLGWQIWYKHVLLKKPKTLFFFFGSEITRNGYKSTLRKCMGYLIKIFVKKYWEGS